MTAQTRSIGYTILKLRSSITACCCAVGLCLIVQVIVWSMVAFTDMRTTVIEPKIDTPMVVETDNVNRHRAALTTNTALSFADAAKPVTVLTRADQFFRDSASLAQSVGTAACMVLLMLMFVGVVLASSEPTSRTHLVVSAMVWAALLAVLTLPFGGLFQLPWAGGALRPYNDIVSDVELWRAGSVGPLTFWTRAVILPALCGLGCVLVMWRFARGIEPLLPEEMHRLDPELERETANIAVTSLHGGRSGAALGRLMSGENKSPASAKTDTLPRGNQVAAGTTPKRII